ncbi:hypothetical protein OG373_06755 [Streptomyces avidinii]|uniref:hypothetical protein n=1 Tax=Streptomyces avidinii TaxID=1895 RepID=UPI00386AA814|nr:hypothetical protein OG373_06755 [Streptomyces avidinii]
MTGGVSRVLAEHEAAHAVVARHFGLTVTEVVIGARSGRTLYRGLAEPWQEAAVIAAGDLFNREQGTVPYLDYGCSDLRDLEREHGLDRLWDANRAARSILTQRRRAILLLADRIQRERHIQFV